MNPAIRCSILPPPEILDLVEKEEGSDGVDKLLAQSTPSDDDGSVYPLGYIPPMKAIWGNDKGQKRPLRGALWVCVVLVHFPDQDSKPGKKEYFEDLFFSRGKVKTGSVAEYLLDASNGKFTISGAVAGSFLMPKKMDQYARSSDFSKSDFGRQESAPNVQDLAEDAAKAAQYWFDYSRYASTGNRVVDAFIVVHAGPDAANTYPKNPGYIWSVTSTLRKPLQIGNAIISPFFTISEDAQIGVICHELGHILLGWPDLYDRDQSSVGVGWWCLMGSGNWLGVPSGSTPCHPSAWFKNQQEWADETLVNTNKSITLKDVKIGHEVQRLWTNGDASSQEYFLIENRRKIGFDAFLPGQGLLVWHLDESVTSNDDEKHPRMWLMQADGRNDLARASAIKGDAGDPFPGTSGNKTFNFTSNPSSKSYAGKETWVSITSISDTAEDMTMALTVSPTYPPEINDHTWYRLSNTKSSSFLTAWKWRNLMGPNVPTDGNWGTRTSPLGDDLEQLWQIRLDGDSYSLRTMATGANFSLDVLPTDDGAATFTADSPLVPGKWWKITPWGDGTYHFSNELMGHEMYLDTFGGDLASAVLKPADAGRPSQRWVITPVREITEPF